MIINVCCCLQVFSIIIAAYRTELFSTAFTPPVSDNRELPVQVCLFSEVDDDNNIYGDRICNNGMACAISSILVAMMLMIVDLQIPCTNSTVGDLCWYQLVYYCWHTLTT